MHRRRSALVGPDLYRRIGLGLAFAVLVVRSASGLQPAYGVGEPILNTSGPQPQQAGTADFNCDGLMDVVWVQGHWTDTSTAPIRILLSDGKGKYFDGAAQVITGTVPKTK